MEIPEKVTCVDCGRLAYRLTIEPEFGFSIGDWVAYRCSGCGDRWDLEIGDNTDEGGILKISEKRNRLVKSLHPWFIECDGLPFSASF